MNKFCGLFVILGVLGDLAFCKKSYYPLPYKNQNEDYSGRIFDSLFNNVVPNEARNDSLTTSPPSTTSKPEPSTTEAVVFYPVYQEPIYDPNYYQIIPPYPILYNAPLDSSQIQLDNVVPYYPVVNNIASTIYSNGIQPVQFFNPGLINANPEGAILQPISANVIPTNVKPSNVPNSPSQSESLKGGKIKDEVQELLTKEVEKLLDEFYVKHLPRIKEQESSESSTKIDAETTSDDVEVDEYKTIAPWATVFPEVSANPIFNRKPSVEKLTNALKQNATNKLDSGSNPVDKNKQDVDIDETLPANESVSNPSTHYKRPAVTKTTQSSIEVNQFGIEAASQNETDDSRKLDFNNEAEEFTTDTTTDKSPAISSKDLIKPLENNHTSADSKLNGGFRPTSESTIIGVKTRKFFINDNGNECMEEVIIYNNKQYKLYTCEEKSYNGKNELVKKTTYKSDVTYFTEELQSIVPSTTELAPQHLVTNDLQEN